MRPALKIFVVFLIIMVTFGLPIILQQVVNPNQKNKLTQTPTPIETQAVDDIRFISVPPILVPAKSTFMYKIIVTSLSGNEVTLSILAKPDWIEWSPESSQLVGTVPDVGGVFTVTLRAATIAGDIQDQTFTVTIDKEQDVKGAKTIGMWKDPFHPAVGDSIEAEVELLPEVTSSTDTTSSTEVLGEKTVATAKSFLTEDQQKYLLIGLATILGIAIISIIIKLAKVASSTRSKLPAGIIIERGGR